jgi:deoxyhypusine synthase
MNSRSVQLRHAQIGMTVPEERNLKTSAPAVKTRAPRIDDLHNISDALEHMGRMTTGARDMGEAADVLCAMFSDDSCKVVLSLSGVASVGKLDLIIADLMDRGHIDAVVSTGAVITHGSSYEMGNHMYQIPHKDEESETQDTKFYNEGYNRVFDTVELEKSLEKTGDVVHHCLGGFIDNGVSTFSSAALHREMGEYFNEHFPDEDGLLHSAARNGVPVFVPSFTDSEIGLSVARYYFEHQDCPCRFDAFLDLDEYGEFAHDAERLGIITLGGGVPRNWAQQIGPFFDELEGHDLIEKKDKPVRFQYGVRICPEFTRWGGLSGCTYSEGISWGKFLPTAEGGKFAEVYCDYTATFPLLIAGVMERLNETKHNS